MSKRTFRPRKAEQGEAAGSEQTLTQMPVAVYYRQSTAAQVGNISTTIQTIDMVDELERRGWQRDKIILIDDDEGVSGMKRIDEREGMSYLFELIAERKIGAVACQDEDRLFRDMTQIQVNIFIDTCRKANVKVITPYITYDFAHPLHGEFHARQFRFKCDMAAEYLKSYVLGRLAPARQRLLREGKWAGARMPVGFMVDIRKSCLMAPRTPTGANMFPLSLMPKSFANTIKSFWKVAGPSAESCARYASGHQLPDCQPPEGFKISYQLKNRGGAYYVNRGSFILLLTNPAYIGHWCYKGMVVRWNNHEPIVDVETFMRAFNYLSQYTLTGEENPNYQPSYPHARPDLDAKRQVDGPLLPGLIYTQFKAGGIVPAVRLKKGPTLHICSQSGRGGWIGDGVGKTGQMD